MVKTHEIFSQNLDKGFDPDDPAVKGIEDWECSNNLDAMDPSLDNLVREIVKTLLVRYYLMNIVVRID